MGEFVAVLVVVGWVVGASLAAWWLESRVPRHSHDDDPWSLVFYATAVWAWPVTLVAMAFILPASAMGRSLAREAMRRG